MSFDFPIRVIIHPISEDYCDKAVQLTQQSGQCHLLKCDAQIVCESVCDNQGAVVTDQRGQVIGICLYKRFRMAIPAGSRGEHGFVEFLYIFNLVVDPKFQGLGIGPRLGEATVGFAFAASEGPFPPVVAGAFRDSPRSCKAQAKAGMTFYPEGDFAIDCDVVMRELDIWVRAQKEALGVTRHHSIQAFNMYHLPVIARWMTRAYEGWVKDADLAIRVHDPSDGCSGFRRALRDLGRGSTVALERLHLARQNDANTTVFRTTGYRFGISVPIIPNGPTRKKAER